MAEKKEFRSGLYGVVASVLVAAILVGTTMFAFVSRYNAFSSEKIAASYVDTIVQNGDGYNALKVSLVSKNQKFGNFVINGYMAPYVNDGKDVKQNEIIGTGSAEEVKLLDTVYNIMYDYFINLLATVGLENYDAFYSSYFEKLKQVRSEIIGDDYMSTNFMFSVFESNVATYGESLTGTEETLAADGETVLKPKSIGKYQEMFGEDYSLSVEVTDEKSLSAEEVEAYKTAYKTRIAPILETGKTKATALDEKKANAMNEAFANLDCADDFSEVKACSVDVKTADGKTVASVVINVVKIGNSWYVDNSNSDTSALYLAYIIE